MLSALIFTLVSVSSCSAGDEPFLVGYVLHGNPDAWRLSVPETLGRVGEQANAVFSVETCRKGPKDALDWQSRGKKSDIERLFTLAEANKLKVYVLFYYGYGRADWCPADPGELERFRTVLRKLGIHFAHVSPIGSGWSGADRPTSFQ
jgi:hypothetical protein